jgi:hypothetical protein
VFGYVILSVAIVMGLFYVNAQADRDRAAVARDRQIQALILRQQERSCRAIKGAAAFWSLQLRATEHSLRDDSLNAIQRSAKYESAAALRFIVNQSGKVALQC